jgi:hypothetical protein
MSFGRRALVALLAGSGIYLSLGGLSVVRAETADRIGVLAPLWVLVPILGLCGLAALLIRSHRWSLLWLPALLLPLPWLPLPVPAAFLLWLGPLASVIWVAVAASAMTRGRPPLIDAPADANSGPRPRGRGYLERIALFTHPRRAPLLAAALAAVIYLLAGWQLSAFLPAGDEPHYLVIADSLRYDGDLKIENNHRAHHYFEYFQGEMKPDYLRRGVDGQIYSIHAPGLPALLLPAYALFGYRGAVVFLALVSALASALAWRLCFDLTRSADAAWFGWAVAALPAPVLFHASSIYPDGMGAILVLTGAAALIHADRLTIPRALLHGAALALLPWLHTRFVLLAAALAICVLARLATSAARTRTAADADAAVAASAVGRASASKPVVAAAAFLAVPAVSAAAWFGFFYVVYGTPDPSAPYGTYTQSALAHIAPDLTGLLFDQQFGLISNAPIYLASVCGLGWMIFRNPRVWAAETTSTPPSTRRFALEVLCVIVPYTLAVAMYRMWWGGWSAPARFLTPALPLLALAAAITFAAARSLTAKVSIQLTLAASLWLSALLLIVRHGRLAYNDRDGFALWADFANPSVDLAAALPSLFVTPWSTALVRASVLLIAGALTWAALFAAERMWQKRRAVSARPLAASATPSANPAVSTAVWAKPIAVSALPMAIVAIGFGYAAAGMIAVTVNWRLAGVTGFRPEVGQVALLRAIDPGGRQLGITYRSAPRLVDISTIPERLRINTATRRAPRDGPLFFMPEVPAGRYRLLTRNNGVLEGRLDVYVGRSIVPIHSFELGATTATDATTGSTRNTPPEFSLPIEASSIIVRPDDRARQHVRQVTLAPQSVAPVPSRVKASLVCPYAVQTMRYARTTVYTTTDRVYLEGPGMWVPPRDEAELLIDREPAPGQPLIPTIPLLLRNGPQQNRVRLDVESWHRDVTLPAGGEAVVEVPASRRGPTPLRVYAAEGFRPSALDPANGDHRRLGVWIELR